MFISLENLKKKINNKKNYLLVGPGASGKTTLILKLIGKHLKYKGNCGYNFTYSNVLFLAPNYGAKKCGIDINNWVKVLKKKKAIAIVCYVPKDIQIGRLIERLKKRERYWKKSVNVTAIDNMVEMCINDRLDMIKDEYDRETLEVYCYKDYFFSYNELYEVLKKNKIKFYVINNF